MQAHWKAIGSGPVQSLSLSPMSRGWGAVETALDGETLKTIVQCGFKASRDSGAGEGWCCQSKTGVRNGLQ
jgi:hypothetical protein